MENIIRRIFLVVISAAVISVGFLFFLLHHMSVVTEKYSALVDGDIENQKLMSEISLNMYRLQAQVAEHVVNTDKEREAGYEEKMNQLSESITELFRQYENRLSDAKEKELFREVTDSYNRFESQREIALNFSRKGATKSAEYYVCTVMDEYLNDANDAFNSYYDRTKNTVDVSKEELREELGYVSIWRNISLVVVVFALLSCLLIVYRSGQTIVVNQRRESDENNHRIMDMQRKTIIGMANLIESRDGETGQHVKRTSSYVSMIAGELVRGGDYREFLTEEYRENLWKAAPLHDIGKIKVSDSILQKPGKLTPEEFDKIKLHTSEGGKIIRDVLEAIDDESYLDIAYQVATYHHEKWDGSGYPEGLKGDEIPLCARIMAVADVFDALVSKRCYKDEMPVDSAYEIIQESCGSHFDPVVAEAFIRIRPQVEEYLREE